MVVSGRYPLFAIIPAVIDLSGATIDDLHLVTLSYSKDNAADLLDLLDTGKIHRVSLMVSHYFAKANAHLYDPLETELEERHQRCIALRTHAKLILMRLSDGRKFTVHSSANLRSCKNIEQACFENDAALYDFHACWIEGLFSSAAEKDKGTP